jgi:hypothetical protein
MPRGEKMGVRTINLWGVLAAIVRSLERKGRKRTVRARAYGAQQAFGSQAPTYGISSSFPPMR